MLVKSIVEILVKIPGVGIFVRLLNLNEKLPFFDHCCLSKKKFATCTLSQFSIEIFEIYRRFLDRQ